MEQWKEAASQQAKVFAARMNELLTKGQEFLRSELGVDLALKPELIQPWVILLAACTGLVLMLAIWASMALFKKRPTIPVVQDTVKIKPSASKSVKSEEPKKRKKRAEKKVQPNGRAVTEAHDEDAIVSQARVPHQQPPRPETKRENALETKRKVKQAVTETVTAVGKEPEEGTWETKVSNKEKREQRKKDKRSSDGSSSPGGGGAGGGTLGATPEQCKASAAIPSVNQKKKKGQSSKVTAEKSNAAASHANNIEAPLVAAVVANSQAVKVSRTVAPKTQGPWIGTREPQPLWKTEIDESWTVIDRIPSDLVSLTNLGVGTGDPQLMDNAPWLSQAKVDDEWSGFTDPSSDWNAPSEVWGNYEEPTPQPTRVQEQPRSAKAKPKIMNLATEEEDEKHNGEAGAAKNKKRKKKKAAEVGEVSQVEVPQTKLELPAPLKEEEKKKKKKKPKQTPSAQEHSPPVEVRLDRPGKDCTPQKPLATQVPLKQPDEHTTVQINLPAPTQQKAEEIQVAKLSKKKKARKET
ncbi:protein LYRIC-like isoform X2 [Syngnathoides biaculeatus]|uniref:protein LYRIC-like isoform X2 n=1 Tax=Syngnathoides biaculeatus TaxID=300417 RepID=UPI002ADE587C|nr:protein LYRIC-like isoform X2 [Syngnathoides biaculeatus]